MSNTTDRLRHLEALQIRVMRYQVAAAQAQQRMVDDVFASGASEDIEDAALRFSAALPFREVQALVQMEVDRLRVEAGSLGGE